MQGSYRVTRAFSVALIILENNSAVVPSGQLMKYKGRPQEHRRLRRTTYRLLKRQAVPLVRLFSKILLQICQLLTNLTVYCLHYDWHELQYQQVRPQ